MAHACVRVACMRACVHVLVVRSLEVSSQDQVKGKGDGNAGVYDKLRGEGYTSNRISCGTATGRALRCV
jgi:hypothetical protein